MNDTEQLRKDIAELKLKYDELYKNRVQYEMPIEVRANIQKAVIYSANSSNVVFQYQGNLYTLSSGGTSLNSGTISMWPSITPPADSLLCVGDVVSRTTYSGIFAVIGTTFGAGDGTTTFGLPDFRGFVPVGYKAGTPDFGTFGGTFGETDHTLQISEIPSHTHPTISAQSPGGTNNAGSSGTAALTNPTTGSTGGGGSHNNVQPSLAINFIIKI